MRNDHITEVFRRFGETIAHASPAAKAPLRRKIENDIQKHLAKGGRIDVVPSGRDDRKARERNRKPACRGDANSFLFGDPNA